MQSLKLALVAVIVAGMAPAVFGTEGGGGAYPNGAEDFMSGALPPPGNYFINYVLYYSADKLIDNGGKDRDPDFDLEIIAQVARFVHVSKVRFLGGTWAQHIFIPVMQVDLTVRTPAGILSDKNSGLGDIIVDPFILGWHGKQWHCAAGVDTYVPLASYDEDDPPNIGRNYWTFEPVFAVTYLTENGYEASAKFMYDFNTENDDTDYQSGEEFHFDYTVGKKISNWSVGLGGFYYEQITSDELDGVGVNTKGRTLACGPQVSCQYKNMNLAAKYQQEMEVRNKPEGERLWLKFAYVF